MIFSFYLVNKSIFDNILQIFQGYFMVPVKFSNVLFPGFRLNSKFETYPGI